jgi:hypothetical protein
MLPPILMKGCSHLDPQCICRNLRSLDDYDDTPKPPPRRIRLVKRIPDEIFVDGTSTETSTEVEVTVTEVTDVVDASVVMAENESEEERASDVSVVVGVDNIDDASRVEEEETDYTIDGSDDKTVPSGSATETRDSIETDSSELEKEGPINLKTPVAVVEDVAIAIVAQVEIAEKNTEQASIEAVLPIVEVLADGETRPGPVMSDINGQSNETSVYNKDGDIATEAQASAGTTNSEEIKYGTLPNETLEIIEEEREFKMCVEECSLHDQIRKFVPFNIHRVQPRLVS